MIHKGTVSRIEIFTLEDTRHIHLRMHAPTVDRARPGQFVMLNTGEDHFLDRPLSILDWGNEHISLLVQVKGPGTESLLKWSEGRKVEFKGTFGNPLVGGRENPELNIDLIAGGIGIVPIHFFVREEIRRSTSRGLRLFFGAETQSSLGQIEGHLSISNLRDSVRYMGVPFRESGLNVVEAYVQHLDAGNSPGHVIACGPTGMLAVVQRAILDRDLTGELVLEERMACGRGMCLGCPVELIIDGERAMRRVCIDGPSFPVGRGREVVFT